MAKRMRQMLVQTVPNTGPMIAKIVHQVVNDHMINIASAIAFHQHLAQLEVPAFSPRCTPCDCDGPGSLQAATGVHLMLPLWQGAVDTSFLLCTSGPVRGA